MATFADLMALLMCFFLLLLSFSEMDVIKFKQIAGSMKMAFGVQRQVEAKIMPKGTSIIAREFSPGKPQPTVIQDIRQFTTDDQKDNLDWVQAEHKEKSPVDSPEPGEADQQAPEYEDPQQVMVLEELQQEVAEGLIDIDTEPGTIIIRIQEKGSFPSGRADLTDAFEPIIAKIARVLADTEGDIYVAGHTDNIPISTRRFRSNWELSAARSVTVTHKILDYADIDPGRVLVEGHADADPLVRNETPEGRARNRRVEIIIRQPQSG
jgi:chemotaxis protein MotB